MDDTFRLIFSALGSTPDAAAFYGPEARTFATFAEAIAAATDEVAYEQPFIAHRYLMFDPSQIALISSQFLSAKPKAA